VATLDTSVATLVAIIVFKLDTTALDCHALFERSSIAKQVSWVKVNFVCATATASSMSGDNLKLVNAEALYLLNFS